MYVRTCVYYIEYKNGYNSVNYYKTRLNNKNKCLTSLLHIYSLSNYKPITIIKYLNYFFPILQMKLRMTLFQ